MPSKDYIIDEMTETINELRDQLSGTEAENVDLRIQLAEVTRLFNESQSQVMKLIGERDEARADAGIAQGNLNAANERIDNLVTLALDNTEASCRWCHIGSAHEVCERKS
jgi:chromosome segregation ATPase